MDVGALMEDLEKSLSPLNEALLCRRQAFSLLVSSDGVGHYLIENRLIGVDWISVSCREGVLALNLKQVFDALS